jgi:hypothetical protein
MPIINSMASILQAQIDFLGEQIDALPPGPPGIQEIDEAIAVALSLFDGTISSMTAATPENLNIVNHWLRSAEAILVPLRQTKPQGHRPPQVDRVMRSILRARAIVRAEQPSSLLTGRHSLDEVEREFGSSSSVIRPKLI